jgi:hypothetical protein
LNLFLITECKLQVQLQPIKFPAFMERGFVKSVAIQNCPEENQDIRDHKKDFARLAENAQTPASK